MYVDESGDTGLKNSPTDYFVLSGLVVHELKWQATLQQLINFRRRMRVTYGLKMDEELHATQLIQSPGRLARIPKYNRLAIIRNFASEIGQLEDCNIINIVVDKTNKDPLTYDVFQAAWNALINRFENTMRFRNFPGPQNADDKGLLMPDQTDNKKLTQLLRKMRYFNPTPNIQAYGSGYRNLAITYIIEDPSFRDSSFSYFIQAVDTAAYLLQQKLNPNSYMRAKNGDRYFEKLEPVLCKVASRADRLGIVRL